MQRTHNRLIDTLEKIDDLSITVEQLLINMKVKRREAQEAEENQVSEDIASFKDCYLLDKGMGMFGNELSLYKIASIEFETFTEDQVRLFKIIGEVVNFSTISLPVIRNLTADANDLFSIRALQQMTKSYEDEFYSYKVKALGYRKELVSIVNTNI